MILPLLLNQIAVQYSHQQYTRSLVAAMALRLHTGYVTCNITGDAVTRA